MVSNTVSSVIIQDSGRVVNRKRKIPPENFAWESGNFSPQSAVDITVWTTLWIMCKTPFPEGVPGVAGPLWGKNKGNISQKNGREGREKAGKGRPRREGVEPGEIL